MGVVLGAGGTGDGQEEAGKMGCGCVCVESFARFVEEVDEVVPFAGGFGILPVDVETCRRGFLAMRRGLSDGVLFTVESKIFDYFHG